MSSDIKISYSKEFEEKDFSEIAKFQNVSVKVYVEKSLEPVGDAIIVVENLIWDPFVTALIGKAVDEVISGLKQLMKYVVKVIKKRRVKTRIIFLGGCTTKYGETEVGISFSDISKLSDEEKMTLPHEIGAKLIAHLNSKDEYIRKIGVTLYNSEVTDFFYVNDKLEVFEAEL